MDGPGLRSIGALVVNCGGAVSEFDVARLWLRLRRLSALGVHAVVAGSHPERLVDTGLDLRTDGPGQLFLWLGEPPEIFEIGPRGLVRSGRPSGRFVGPDVDAHAAPGRTALDRGCYSIVT